MKKVKSLSLKKILLSVLTPLTLGLAVTGGSLVGDSAKALPTYPTEGTSIATPLYDFNDYRYSQDALDELAKAILNDPSKDIDDLINYIKRDALTGGKAVEQKNITLQYGRYRNSMDDPYTNLAWMPVYMSTTNDAKKDAVLTLYLTTVNGPISQQEYGAYSFDGQTTSSPESLYPANMYGTSYVRASILGNGGQYVTYPSGGSYQLRTAERPTYESCNKYLDFLEYNYTVNETTTTRKGYLYDDIVTPSQLAWQSDESYKKYIGATGDVTYDEGVTFGNGGTAWENYCWPNEAYGTPSEGSFFHENYFDYGGNASAKKSGYDTWKNDKVWLPSLTEVGTGNITGTDTSGLNGIWKLTKNQRANDPGNSMMAAQPVAWLRTANTEYNAGQGYSTSHIFVLEEDGSVGIRNLNTSPRTIAVRPAIHLNLSSAKDKINPPVNLPDTVTATYNGAVHRLDSTNMTLTPEQAPWFIQGQMNVEFSYDAAFTKGKEAYPINAGEYYMRVTLDNPNLYFVNADPADPRRKVVKFVVEKAKIGVKWTYDGNVPSSVDLSPSSSFYPRDIAAGNIPELGIRYRSYTTPGLYFYDFNELLRGTYSAQAYIIDEDLYNYNYQLSDDMGDPVQSDSTFDVGRMIVDKPVITSAGTGVPDPANSGIITYTISYKGAQYIQVENVNKYLRVSVTAKDGGLIECLNPAAKDESGKDLPYPQISDAGTLTYKVKDVDLYTFTFAFPNSTQFTWPGTYDFSTGTDDGAITTPEHLAVNVTRAKLEVDIVGLPNEWNTITIQSFTIELRGVYEDLGDEGIPLSVMYLNDQTGKPQSLTPTGGVYTLSNLVEGNYTLYVSMVNSADNIYNKLYLIESGNIEQKFRVIRTVSEFKDSLVQWQYTHDGATLAAGGYLDHDTENSALEFDYDGEYFAFSLTIPEATLRDVYYVKAIYSGSKFVKDAGMHSITVAIKAYYKNVQVDEKEYVLYFKIKPVKYDLSGLEWDYDASTPFVYSGASHKVGLTAASLAALPGLTAEYSTEGNRIDAGSYKTVVTFLVSDEYAKNYILPVANDENSYEGATVGFSCDWIISKAKITVEWINADDSSSTLLFIPKLKKGNELVNYSYLHKEADGSWSPATDLVADGADEIYRVEADLKLEYAANYELDGNVPSDEFTVSSGKHAISIHFEHDGKICQDGDQFKYNGKTVELELKVDSDALTLGNYSFKYYSVGAGDVRTELAAAPYDVGKYVAVVTAKFSTDSYISEDCSSEIAFEIIKGDYDPEFISWMYDHGGVVISGKYDVDQGKFVDDHGKEVEFTFEYDGTPHVLTVECQQEFPDHPEDVLTVFKLSGNSATGAGDYTAAVDFTYNSSRFNDPHDIFPRLLSWKISKKKIDYNEVRWGYFTKDGKEREFDFENDSFRYTRDEDGAVGITVGLIGLPDGVQALMTYQTKSLSVADATALPGNTRAAVGEYLTTFTITGTWNDPLGNHEDFDASTFPLSIPASQVWSIKRRELSKLDYDGSWTKFDDRAHDIIELSKIPYDQLNYFKVEITFIDKAFAVYNDYAGYEGVTNALYHAGTYDIKLYEKTTIFKNGAEVEDLIVWDTLTLDIDKAELEVSWDENGAYPVARASAVFATDMINTVYTRLNGAEVPIAYIKSTNGDEEFYATVKIADDYVNDINIRMAANTPEKVQFTYSPFSPQPGVVELDMPKIVKAEQEFTGSAITFEIEGWDTYYQTYLYISAGSLVQTDQGEYSVVIRFYKNANAYWKNTTSSSGDYNRDAVTLTFKITPPTKWALDYPMLDETRKQWADGEEIEFKITNWVALSKYITFEVFYKNESQGNNLIYTRGGNYTIEFTIPETSIGYWKENKDAPRSKYILQFQIDGDPDHPVEEIPYPKFVNATAEYNGSPIQFKVEDWDSYFSQYLEISSNDAVTIKDGIITATNEGVYTVTFKIKSGVSLTFAKGATTYSLNFSITPKSVNPGQETAINKPSIGVTEQEYNDGNDIVFSITGWISIYSQYLEISCDDEAVVIDNVNGTLKVKNIGKYTITLSFKEGVKAYWVNTDKSTDPVQLTFEVTPPSDPTKVVKPSFKVDEKQFSNKDQIFELVNFDAEKVEIVEGSDSFTQKAIGDYTVTLRLKNPKSDENPDGLTWLDGTTDDITLNFSIVKVTIPDGGHVDIGSDGKPVIVDEDGNPIPGFDFDFGDYIDVEYYDKDGNKVNKEDLIPGEKYTVKLIVKNPEEFDKVFEDGPAIRDDITDRNGTAADGSDSKFVINNYQPSDPNGGKEDPDSGFNPLWWIAIGAGILAVIAIIGVIIGLATRRNGGDGGYDDGYDDYEDDYDDEDDEDDYDDGYDDDYDDYDDEY